MCGILVHISETSFDLDNFNAALDLQSHRGPDDRGVHQINNLLFGHRRLSIIDLEHSAAQPMLSDDKSIIIVFNGEIYNFIELRDELEKEGVEFKTHGDTEVLIKLFERKGIDFIQDIIGMFAFVIHNRETNETYVVRDRLGIKPLYYYSQNNELIFSSEIKSIIHLKSTQSKINVEAISSYFSFRYPILNDTFYDDILSLSPGYYLRIKDGHVETIEYWNLIPFIKEQENDKGEEYYLHKIHELLKSSIKYRQIADVKVGAYLSGGVDSSAIVAFMAQNTADPVPTFTIGFEEVGYNELPYARQVADRYKTNHNEIILSGEDYLSTMEQLIEYKDAPLSVPNEVPLYLMSRELKKYITVVLSGEGADEIFGGYGRIFRSCTEYANLELVNNKTDLSDEDIIFLKKIEKKYGRTMFENELDHFYTLYSYTNESLKSHILNDKCHNEIITEKLKNKFQSYFDELGPDVSYLNKMMYVFEKIHLVGLLHRVDMTTMATSVEARVPFVDHRLVELAFTIPLKYKLKWNSEEKKETDLLLSEEVSEHHDIPKYILKKSLENELDDNILYRKKMGFPVPLDKWFAGDFNRHAREIILDKNSSLKNFVKMENIENILSDPALANDHGLALKVWMIMNLSLFMQSYEFSE